MNKMKKTRIVSYETAKMLYEKGFREKVCNIIYPDGTIESCDIFDYNSIDKSQETIVTYSAPTLNQVVDWLMDNYGIFMEINFLIVPYYFSGKYKCSVIDTNDEEFGGTMLYRTPCALETKEMALQEGISKAICKIEPLNFKTENIKKETIIEENFFKKLNEKEKIEYV